MRIVLIDTAYPGDLVLAAPLVRAAAGIATGGKIDVVTSPPVSRLEDRFAMSLLPQVTPGPFIPMMAN